MNRPYQDHNASRVSSSDHSASAPPFQSVNLLQLFSVLQANLVLITSVTIAGVIVMLIYLMSLPAMYTAYSQVILDTREERITPAQEVMSNLDVTSAVIAGEIITMRSNVLLGQVVDQMNLIDEPEFDPRVRRFENPIAFLKRIIRGDDKPHVVASRLPEEALRSFVIVNLRNSLSVSQLGISYAIGIDVKNTNPELAAAIANGIADRYIDSQLDIKLLATQRANAWLSDRLSELSLQVEEADRAVVEFKAEMIDAAGGNEENINQLIAELNTKLVGSSTDRADAEVRLGQVEELLEAGGISSIADVLTSPLLESLQQQHAELAATRAKFASILGARHPEMLRISAQIADIDRSIQNELQRRVEEMRIDVKVTRNREAALRQQIEAVSDRADSLSKASVRLSQLERTADATRLVYENFLARFKETTAQASFQTPEARVIGRADVPIVPSGPRKTMSVIAAAVFSMAAAIAYVFINNLVRSPVVTPEELRTLTHLPTMAALPRFMNPLKKSSWLKEELRLDTASSYLDRVKSIRTHLFHGAVNQRPKIIFVTSSLPDEGKTSLCCALANVFSQPKQSVLLIDVDLRRPDIRETLGMPEKGACLVDSLQGKVKMQELVLRSDLLGVDVISPARPAANATDLLEAPVFSGLLARLSSKYDVIIMNGPPVIHLSDAALLGSMADATLLVVRSEKTPSKVIVNSLRRLKSSNVNVVGTVLTMIRRSRASRQELEMYSQHY